MRIVSLLPAATEILASLGLLDELVGVSHECAHPPQVKAKPVVMRGLVEVAEMSQAEIDVDVTRRLSAGEPIYELDLAKLAALAPELMITQDLCQVCAASPRDLAAALAVLDPPPRVLQLTPRNLEGIFGDILQVGEAAGRSAQAAALVAALTRRVERVADRARAARRVRVFCMEWLDPPYCSGHWVPEMIELAGGEDALSRKGSDSVRISWDAVRDWAPELLLLIPCGYDVAATLRLAEALPALPGWTELPAVQARRVFAADANAYFACPGPRVVDGLELLAHLIHPELFVWNGSAEAFAPLPTQRCARCSGSLLGLARGREASRSGEEDALCARCLAATPTEPALA